MQYNYLPVHGRQLVFPGCAVEEVVTDSDLVEYSSCDLLMRTTFTQDSVWEDLGVTEDSHRAAVAQNLAALGWNMVSETSLPALAQASPALFTCKVMLLSLSYLSVADSSGANANHSCQGGCSHLASHATASVHIT